MTTYWYARRVNKPYDLGDGWIYINLYSSVLERGLAPAAYHAATDHQTAKEMLYGFYGKHLTQLPRVINPEYPHDDAALPPVQYLEVYFPKRRLANPILRYRIGKKGLMYMVPVTSMSTGNESISIQIRKIPGFLRHIETAFKVYQQQLKFYQGSVSPRISFLELYHQLKLYFENLEEYVNHNGYRLKDYKTVLIEFHSTGTGANRRTRKIILDNQVTAPVLLIQGNNFFFEQKSIATNRYVNELVLKFNAILADTRSTINWTQFVFAFLTGIQVNPYGKPHSPTVASETSKMIRNSDMGPLGSTKAAAARDNKFVKNRANALAGVQEVNKALLSAEVSLQSKLDGFVGAVQDAADDVNKVAEILTEYRIAALVEAALECLLFNMPGYAGGMPDMIPGIDPFAPIPPKIKIEFPKISLRLPILSINGSFEAMILEGLKAAAIAAVKGILDSIADLIRAMCLDVADSGPPASPPDALIRDFPAPGIKPPEDPLKACYEDSGLLQHQEETEAFLTAFSPEITAREMCDLLNGNPSGDVKQVLQNLLYDGTYPNVAAALSDIDAIIQLFMCLGDLIDPAYCQNVYNSLIPHLPDLDPCDVEDNPAYHDLMDLLDNIHDLIEAPDMSCGGGIVPPYSDVAPFNHSIRSLIDTVLQPAQQTFLTDLAGFRSRILVIDPTNPENPALSERLAILNTFMPEPTDPAAAPPDAGQFLAGLLPSDLVNSFATFGNAQATLTGIGNIQDPQEVIRSIQSRLTYVVAPKTRIFYEEIENNFKTSYLLSGDAVPGSPFLNMEDLLDSPGSEIYAQYYAFLTSIPILSDDLAQTGKSIVYSITGIPNNQLWATTDPYAMNPFSDTLLTYNNIIGAGEASHTGYDMGNHSWDSTPEQNLRTNRLLEADRFEGYVFDRIQSLEINNHPFPTTKLETFFRKKYYPFIYFSIINLAAYKLANSPLFTPSELLKLNLFPKFCANTGEISSADLLDANNIKQEALNEFIANACPDTDFVLGPVRDAAILGLVKLYLQVLGVDLLLKNIFMVDQYGSNFIADGTGLIGELLYQAQRRIVATDSVSFMTKSLPRVVKDAAAISVRNIIKRMEAHQVDSFGFPISGRPVALQNFMSAMWSPTMDWDNDELKAVAIQYLFEQRIQNSSQTINEFFNVRGANTIETYLYEGILDVDILRPGIPGSYPNQLVYIEPNNTATCNDGTIPCYETRTYTFAGAGLEGTHAQRFFKNLNYFDPNETTSRQLDETNSILKYGALVKEKFVQIQYNSAVTSTGSTLFDALAIIPDIQDFFDSSSLQPIAENGDIKTYILSFPQFKKLFQMFATLYQTIAPTASGTLASGMLEIPFYLAGIVPSRSAANEQDGDRYSKPIESKIQLTGRGPSYPGAPGGDSYHGRRGLTDYELIRFWMKEVAVALEPEMPNWASNGYAPDPTPGTVDDTYNGTTDIPPPPLWKLQPQIENWRRARIKCAGAACADSPGFYTSTGGTRYGRSGVFSPYNESTRGHGPSAVGPSNMQWLPELSGMPQTAIDAWEQPDVGNIYVENALRLDQVHTWQENAIMHGGVGHDGYLVTDEERDKYRLRSRYAVNEVYIHGSVIAPGVGLYESEKRYPDGWPAGSAIDGVDGTPGSSTDVPNHSIYIESKNFAIRKFWFRKQLLHDTSTAGFTEQPGQSATKESYNVYLVIQDKRAPSGWRDRRSYLDFYKDNDSDVDEARSRMELMKALMIMYPTQSDLLDALGEFGAGSAQMMESLVTSIFPSIQFGNRLAYVTPEFNSGFAAQTEGEIISGQVLTNNEDAVEKYGSYYTFKTDATTHSCANFATSFEARVDVTNELIGPELIQFIQNNGTESGFARYVDHFYENSVLPLTIPNLANQATSRGLFGDGQTIDLKRILQYLYLTGEIKTYYQLFRDVDIFNDTKQVILLALQAAFAGDDYEADSRCNVTALQNTAMNGMLAAASPFASMGQSFIKKMLIETPKHILKGIVELTEPHVIIAKLIRDITRSGFENIEQLLSAAGSTADLANLLANAPGALNLCDEEVALPPMPEEIEGLNTMASNALDNIPEMSDIIAQIQNFIDTSYPEGDDFPESMKPSVSLKDGINLEGSIPFTFFVPPITPFGILYLILQLMDFPLDQVQTADDNDCE